MDEDLMAMFQSLDDGPVVREDYKWCPFSYPGTKADSLPHILHHLPRRESFIEVFGGSGVITLNRTPSKLDVFNDRYAGVVCFFRVVRDPTLRQQLVERINISPHAREEFIWCKRTWEAEQDPVERAARWYVMVQSSFGGRGRFFGRVLKGRGSMWQKIQENLDLFTDVGHRFLRVQIENLDWRQCLKDYDNEGAVIYLDPPYVDLNIYDHQMSRTDHHEMCERVMGMRGFVALSGYDNDIYPKFAWDEVVHWEVMSKMTTQAFDVETSLVQGRQDEIRRKLKNEYLWIKY